MRYPENGKSKQSMQPYHDHSLQWMVTPRGQRAPIQKNIGPDGHPDGWSDSETLCWVSYCQATSTPVNALRIQRPLLPAIRSVYLPGHLGIIGIICNP